MAIDLLINKGASSVGNWVVADPPYKVTPYRIVVGGSFGGDSVIIEELVGGLPVSPGPLQGNPGLLTPNTQNGGVVVQLASVTSAQDIIVNAPTEFIRARTGPALTGTASVYLVGAQ